MGKVLIFSIAILFGGCSYLQPAIDECAEYETSIKRSYCYASKEVSSAQRATAQALRDGAIDVDRAVEVREVLYRADRALDVAERLILAGDDGRASTMLKTLRDILMELDD